MDKCCKHSFRSRCRRTNWPSRKWRSHKSSYEPPATQLSNSLLFWYNHTSCSGRWLSSWTVSLVKTIQRWKINAHFRGFAGATCPALQLLYLFICAYPNFIWKEQQSWTWHKCLTQHVFGLNNELYVCFTPPHFSKSILILEDLKMNWQN